MPPVGEVDPSLAEGLELFPLFQLPIALGVGLLDRFGRLEVEELPNVVLIELGARPPCLELIPESSLLTDGRNALESSLLLLCRWL